MPKHHLLLTLEKFYIQFDIYVETPVCPKREIIKNKKDNKCKGTCLSLKANHT